ncbi:hypothetical protein GOP47_0019848 [Adiantum capillus-veneris]|uniref:Sugar phosphate transporter domain-containing protein n=1 Tax=Adiantum capillus-veneris TaxID=13818 RepID=A0A9D4Z7F5_ADICA|nr:hypothetical protein GOP47_0019848 [Adiantum capillus-veneris]
MYQAWSKFRSLLLLKEQEVYTQQLKSVGVSLLYGSVALVMGFVNKGILQFWPYSNSLLTLQMASSVAIIYAGKYLNLLHARPLQLKSARSLFPVVFFYNANVAFALAGLQVLNIPIFNALKRLTPVLVIAGKCSMGDGLPPKPVLLSVATIVIGCIIAGLGDLSFDVIGYLLAFASCILQSTYLILVEKSGKEQGYNSHELLLYNAMLSFPVLLVLIMCSGEGLAALVAFKQQLHSPTFFLPLLLLSLMMGALLNYSLFLCTLRNSALTTTVVGAMKAPLSSVLGFFVLGGVKVTFMVVFGVFLNTVGGICKRMQCLICINQFCLDILRGRSQEAPARQTWRMILMMCYKTNRAERERCNFSSGVSDAVRDDMGGSCCGFPISFVDSTKINLTWLVIPFVAIFQSPVKVLSCIICNIRSIFKETSI